MSWAAPEQHFG